MKTSIPSFLCLISLSIATSSSRAATLTNDTIIDQNNTNFDGQDIIVTNCTVTIDGFHTFNNVRLLSGAALTHSFSANGVLADLSAVTVTGEMHVVSSTNPAPLNHTNVLTNTVGVIDSVGHTYLAGVDYGVVLTNAITMVTLLPGSSIPEGGTVIVSYVFYIPPISTGLYLTISNNFEIEQGAAINVSRKGLASLLRSGAGASLATTNPYPFTAGSGGGHGGYGAPSSTRAPGGDVFGSILLPAELGGVGGNGSGPGGIGGGLVQLSVGGLLRVDGAVTANGGNGTNGHSGGGAGGGILLSAQTFSGGGLVMANGGAGELPDGGGGGGGRVAIYYATNQFSGTLSAHGGASPIYGGAGTIFTRASAGSNGQVVIDNGGARGTNTPISVAATPDLVISGGAVGQILQPTLEVRSLVIRSNSWVTQAASQSNPILSITGDATIEEGGGINIDGKGGGPGQGVGAGYSVQSAIYGLTGSGGGNAGYGGASAGGALGRINPAGNIPVAGSGGGAGGGTYPNNTGGAGGGALFVKIGGNLVLDGEIRANGQDGMGSGSGGGSAGSLFIDTHGFAGVGRISANGGSGELPYGGGGSGGRIAISYSTNTFTGSFLSLGGAGANYGAAGTLVTRGRLDLISTVIVDNGGHSATNTYVSAPTAFNLTVRGHAGVSLISELIVRSFVLTDGSRASLGQNFRYVESMIINSNSWITSASATFTVASNASVELGSGINLDGQGNSQSGSSAFGTGSGAGYGGYGGNSTTNRGGGNSYGSIAFPNQPGSKGSNTEGAAGGGGVLTLNVRGTLALDGAISVNGLSGFGGGSGGSIWLTVGTLTGHGLISANGGVGIPSYAGGGGGGRIAIYYNTNLFSGTISARGGSGENYGGAGTIYLSTRSKSSGQLIIDNAGFRGTNTPITSLPDLSGAVDLTVTGKASVFSTILGPIHSLLIASNSSVTYSNRSVVNVSNNVTIQSGSALVMDGMGFGPGLGAGTGRVAEGVAGGGGYGGYGGSGHLYRSGGLVFTGQGGTSYGLLASPNDLGSGGGWPNRSFPGGSGGGALQMNVVGKLQVDGSLSANGLSAASGGGGSGGSIWLSVGTLAGGGLIAANGGSGGSTNDGGGGGGRIAIYHNTNVFTGSIGAKGGPGAAYGGAGTIYLKEAGNAVPQVLVDNGGQRGTNTSVGPSPVQTSFDLTISGGAALEAGKGGLSVRNLILNSNAWLTGISNLLLQLSVSGNATVRAGGGITADGLGDSIGRGVGAGSITTASPCGTTSGGGGYGAFGGSSIGGAAGGKSYGSIVQPTDFGSRGAGAGGGAIKIVSLGSLQVDGTISANGNNAANLGGGGSGGSVWLTAGTISGQGTISANGGSGDYPQGGGGGGGRVAVYYGKSSFSGNISAFGGAGAVYGGAGTVFTRANNDPAGKLMIDNGGMIGANTPLSNSVPFATTISRGAVVYPSSPALVLGSLLIDSGATLTQLSTQSNIDLIVLGNALVQTNGSIDVDAKGYNGANPGPGAGLMVNTDGSGAGYGGAGGASASGTPGGTNYGSATEPTDLGSRGGMTPPYPGFCQGGGAVRMRVAGTLTVNGRISSDGNSAMFEGGGGGSGGSAWLTARQVDGFGFITANGGQGEDSGGGGGGGGRIAIYTRSNHFAGGIFASGGLGANPGQDGTLLVTNIPTPQIVRQVPNGVINSTLNYVDLMFESLMNFTTASPADFSLDTPVGLVLPNGVSISPSNNNTLRVSFPVQSAVGYYEIEAGPQIEDIYGQPMSAAYVGSFVILAPVISGRVTDGNGLPVPYVTLHPTAGLLPGVTDSSGLYALEVPPSWTGTITASRGTSLFIPSSRSFTNVSANLTNQNFIQVSADLLTISAQRQGPNLNLSWYGLNGVTYQLFSSPDLINWNPVDSGLIFGKNGPAGLLLRIGPEPAEFFRFSTSY